MRSHRFMNQALITTLGQAPAVDSIASYLHWANSVPMLSAEREYELAKRLQNEGDIEAAKELILPHIRYVARIAKDFSGYGLAFADLVQEGSIGLMKAVKRFDPDQGVRLASYAVHWIKSEMHEFVIKNWRIVKMATTKAQRKLFFNLRKHKKRLGWQTEAEIKAVALDLNVSEQDVKQMELRLASYDECFDGPLGGSDDELATAPVHYLTHDNSDPALALIQQDQKFQHLQQLQAALTSLDERSQSIIQQRWMNENKTTLQDLAKQFNVSIERVRQLEKAAMNKIKSQLT